MGIDFVGLPPESNNGDGKYESIMVVFCLLNLETTLLLSHSVNLGYQCLTMDRVDYSLPYLTLPYHRAFISPLHPTRIDVTVFSNFGDISTGPPLGSNTSFHEGTETSGFRRSWLPDGASNGVADMEFKAGAGV